MNPEHTPVLQPSPRSAPDRHAPTAEDEATRLLAAAAHADDEFADTITEEYLRDPRRAVPPSPGLNAATVLREVIKARRRRLRRDGTTIVLFLLVLWFWWPVSLLWPVAAVVLAAVTGGLKISTMRGVTARRGASVAASIVAVLIGFILLLPLAGLFFGYFVGVVGGSSLTQLLGLLAGLALLAVLLHDQWHVRQLLATTFDRANFHRSQVPETTGSDPIGPQHEQRLAQVTHNSNGNLIVHHGHQAFVGYGELLNAWSMVMHLRKKDSDDQPSVADPPVQLDVAEIHRAVSREMLRLRDAEGLAPGFRLRDLAEGEQVVISSTALLRHRDFDRLTRSILPTLDSAPNGFLTEAQVREISTGSREWIRSYRGYQIDSWDEDLVITAFLRISCGDGVLYLEWSVFRLNPISDRYRWEMWELASPRQTLGVVLSTAVGYPLSLLARLRRLGRAGLAMMKETPTRIHPDVYGARKSIREIATAAEPQNYFQDVDTIRYLRLLEERLLVAVRRFLEQAGLSTEDFDQQRQTVVNSTVINGGQFSGVNVVGQGNRAQGNQAQGNQAQGRTGSGQGGK
ncbi:MAG: DUF456 domain-containing protein [Pseudonocardiaceae bacterium]